MPATRTKARTTERRVVLGKDSNASVRNQLAAIVASSDAPAAARVNAARTLAELDGQLGRHQAAPDRGAVVPLSQLSRDALASELERLRTAVDLGLVR